LTLPAHFVIQPVRFLLWIGVSVPACHAKGANPAK
jgi:hypothetical protein